MTSRGVIVNADDFGQSAGINRGVIQAHESGIVTSASLMVRGAAAAAAAAYARAHPGLSVGLHVDLNEWSYQQGRWVCLYDRIGDGGPAAVDAEIAAQFEMFGDLVGRAPTHLDSHQHVHREAPARAILQARAAALRVPLRHFSTQVRHDGGFYGQSADGRTIIGATTPARLAMRLRCVPLGVTELGCHPGYADDVTTMYRHERAAEVDALCSREARRVFLDTDVRLMSFLDLPKFWPAAR